MKVTIISILIIGILLFLFLRKKTIKKEQKITAKEFVEKIDALGYFKYTSQENVDLLKKSHLENFDSKGAWGNVWDEETSISMDFRYYFCDGEALFEAGGFINILEEMKFTFDKIGFKITIDEHFEDWDIKNEWLNHWITINGTKYVIFKNFKGYGWGEAAERLAQILNLELDKQHIKERIYLINAGNDGSLIFLDEKLYLFFYQVFTNPKWKPLEVNEWTRIM